MHDHYIVGDFDQLVINDSYKTLEILWESYSSRKPGTKPEIIEGNFRLDIKNTTSLIEQKTLFSSYQKLRNPYPDLIFSDKEDNITAVIPGRRLKSVNLFGTSIFLEYNAHDIKKLSNLPFTKPSQYGTIRIDADDAIFPLLFEKLKEFFSTDQDLQIPRCKHCGGLLGLKSSHLSTTVNLEMDDFICIDCWGSLVDYLIKAERYWAFLKEKGSIPSDMINERRRVNWKSQLQNVSDAILRFNCELLDIFTYIVDSPEEQLEEFQPIISRIQEYLQKNPNKTIKEKIKLIQGLIEHSNVTENPKSNEVEIQKENNQEKLGFEENKTTSNTEEDSLVDKAIDLLQQAQTYQKEKKYQAAINAIYNAAEPLVDAGIWGEEELIIAQKEVAQMKKLIQQRKDQTKTENKEKLLKKEKTTQGIIPKTTPSLEKKPQDKKTDTERERKKSKSKIKLQKPSIPKNNIAKLDEGEKTKNNRPLFPPKIELREIKPIKLDEKSKSSKMSSEKAHSLEFTAPEEIPIDEEAQALGEALQYEPSIEDMGLKPQNHSEDVEEIITPQTQKSIKHPNPPPPKEPPLPSQSIQIKAPKLSKSKNTLEFTAPEEIPIDEEAQALGEALQYEPSENDLSIQLDSKNNTEMDEKERKTLLDEKNLDSKTQVQHPIPPPPKEPPGMESKAYPSILKPFQENKQKREETLSQPTQKTRLSDEKLEEDVSNPLEVLQEKLRTDESCFEEVPNSALFFGIKKKKEECEPEKKPKDIFNLFNQETNLNGTGKSSQQDQSQLNKDTLVNLARRKRKQKRSNNAVKICPMCGKIAKECTCGYMKK